MKKILSVLILLILFTGCAMKQQTNNVATDTQTDKFAVYLADSNQIIFSEEDIISYELLTKTFIFTPEGAKKMKSYQPSSQISSGLYQKSFVVKLGNEEIYRGKFWTNFSSLSENGIVMTDVLMVGPGFNTLTVSSGYPSNDLALGHDKQINDPQLIEHFKNINKI
ncbi:MAG: hypothetical protein V1898_00655 [Patescibacteria group bacterium]